MDTIYYGNTALQWLAVLVLILVSVQAGRLVYWIFTRLLRILTRKTKTRLDDIIIDMIEEPVSITLAIIAIFFSLKILYIPPAVYQFIQNIFWFAITLTLSWLLARLYDALHQEYLMPLAKRSTTDLDDEIMPVLRNGIRAVIWILGIIVGLNNAGFDIGAVLAGLGIGGLAFALAAQDTVANLFGGITILMGHPFRTGDRIQIIGKDIIGDVKEIGLRSTIVVDRENRRITIPNKNFTENPIKNISSEPTYLVSLPLQLAADCNAQQVETGLKILGELMSSNPQIAAFSAVVDAIDSNAITVQFSYQIKHWETEEAVIYTNVNNKVATIKNDIALSILRRFAEANVPLAYFRWPAQAGDSLVQFKGGALNA